MAMAIPSAGRGRCSSETVDTSGSHDFSDIPQSAALRSIERVHRDDEDRLVVDVRYVDPITLTAPLESRNRYLRSDFDMTVYGCIPDPPGEEE